MNNTIYLAYQSTENGNFLIGRVIPQDYEAMKSKGFGLYKTTLDKVGQDEKGFKPLRTNIDRPIKKITKTPVGYDYTLIPKNAIKGIRKAYENQDFEKLDNYRIKYKVAGKCPSCQNQNKRNSNIFQYFLENYLNES